MARSLQLDRYDLGEIDFGLVGCYRLRIEATHPVNCDPNVFIWHRGTISPYTGEFLDEAQAIAGPVDMTFWPVGEPDPLKPHPFFRLNYIEFDLRATTQAEEVWLTVIREVNFLLKALDRLDHLRFRTSVCVGDCPAPVPPSSASSHSSASG